MCAAHYKADKELDGLGYRVCLDVNPEQYLSQTIFCLFVCFYINQLFFPPGFIQLCLTQDIR